MKERRIITPIYAKEFTQKYILTPNGLLFYVECELEAYAISQDTKNEQGMFDGPMLIQVYKK